ncbi:MAG: LamG-like jellyroll fold domain-containing protein [Akkermansiaceae bacterium]
MKLKLIPTLALTALSIGSVANAAITVQQHLTFNDNAAPAGFSNTLGSASYSGGQIVLDGDSYISGPSGLATTDNIGFEVIATGTTFGTFQFPIAVNEGSSDNVGLGILEESGWKGIVQGQIVITPAAASSTGVETRLAFVRADGTNNFYVNGVLVSTNGNAPGGADLDTLHIGANPFDGAAGGFTGSINEVRTFSFNSGEFATSDLLTGATVPEPSSSALLGLGGLALVLRRRK